MFSNFIVIAFLIISATIYVRSETEPEGTEHAKATTLQEDSQTAPPLLAFKPIPLKKASTASSIDEEGEFNFSIISEENDYRISIHGAVIYNDTTKAETLQLSGDYKFGNLSISFIANEMEGFVVYALAVPQAGVPIKVIASIVGK